MEYERQPQFGTHRAVATTKYTNYTKQKSRNPTKFTTGQGAHGGEFYWVAALRLWVFVVFVVNFFVWI
jgi:hypothetical protein